MPNSLSVRNQKNFILAYSNLLNDSDKRIHKADVNMLNKILNKCDNVEVSQLLINKMESYPKKTAALEDTFKKLFYKLEVQNSKLHDKKEYKLKNIQQKLAPVVQGIHNNKINSKIKDLDKEFQFISRIISQEKNEITKHKKKITNASEQIKTLRNEIQPLPDEIKNTSPAAFAAKDAQRLAEAKAEKNQLENEKNDKINKLNEKISAHENSRTDLLNFANQYSAYSVDSVERALEEAESGAIYDKRNTGFGTTSWREHMGSDEYAIKHFGYNEEGGNHLYSATIKKPNYVGKRWQKLMQKFNDAPGKIEALKTKISQLKNEYKADISNVNYKYHLSAEQDIQYQNIVKKEEILFLEMSKKNASSKLESCLKKIPVFETEKNLLIAKIKELKSHIK